MEKILALLILTVVFFACKHEPSEGFSDCIEDKIEDFKSKNLCPNPSIVQYNSEIGYLYLFDIGLCPDAGAQVYDSNCTEICFLGGFAGITTCLFDGDTLHLTDEKVIWKR